MTGSDYGELRERYDEEYMANYESSFIKTKDGKLSMPSYSDMYDKKRDYKYETCLLLFDTEIERNISLGTDYKYDPMTEGQCLIN